MHYVWSKSYIIYILVVYLFMFRFNDAVSSGYIMSNGRTADEIVLKRIWKWSWPKVRSRYFLGVTEEGSEELGQLISAPRFEFRTPGNEAETVDPGFRWEGDINMEVAILSSYCPCLSCPTIEACDGLMPKTNWDWATVMHCTDLVGH